MASLHGMGKGQHSHNNGRHHLSRNNTATPVHALSDRKSWQGGQFATSAVLRAGARAPPASGVQSEERGIRVGSENTTLPDYPRAWFYPSLPWGAPVTDFPPDRLRGQTLMLIWEIFTLVWVLYIAYEVPYRTGYFRDDFPACDTRGQQAMDIFSDLVFLADAFVQSHAAYWECAPLDGKWVLIDKLDEIRALYVRELLPWNRSLVWDLIAGFPFLQIGCAMRHSDPKIDWQSDARDFADARPYRFVMFLSMLRLLKGLRLWKISEWLEDISMQSPGWANVISLVQLLFMLFFGAHFLGCIWFNIGISTRSIENGWLDAEGSILPRDESNYWYEWVASMYWAVATMTTIGYGDISAHTSEERIFAMFSMISGSAYFAWLAGTVTGILSSSSAGHERFLGFLEEVRQYLDVNRFSEEIKRMVFVFYGLKFPTKNIFQEQDIMDSLPQGLQKRMRSENYMQLIEAVPLFSELSEATKMDICNHFSTQLCSAGETLCTEGEEAENLFILKYGSVLLSHKGERLCVAQPGDMFGELALLGLTMSGQRLRTAVALSECELLKLTYRNLKILIVTNIELKVAFRKMAVRFMKICSKEFEDPKSPIHEPIKLVHITMSWQTGEVPDHIRQPGRIPPPILKTKNDRKEIKTLIYLRMHELSGLPQIDHGAGVVMLKTEIDWDARDGNETRQFSQEHTFKQNSEGVKLNWQTLLKYSQFSGEVVFPAIVIKIIFKGIVGASHGSDIDAPRMIPNNVSSQVGVTGPSGFSVLGGQMESVPCVPAPHRETVIACFKLSSEAILTESTGSSYTNLKLSSKWFIGDHSGPLALDVSTKVSRELPAESLIKSVLRPLFKKHFVKSKDNHKVGGTKHGGTKWLREIKAGVVNVLTRGDNGKGGASACSVENQLEKNTEEIISRLRDMRDQIDKKISRLDEKVENLIAEQSERMSAEMNRVSTAVQAEMNRLNQSLESNMISRLGFTHEELQSLDKRLEALALDTKNNEELILRYHGIDIRRSVRLFNFASTPDVLKTNSAPPRHQPSDIIYDTIYETQAQGPKDRAAMNSRQDRSRFPPTHPEKIPDMPFSVPLAAQPSSGTLAPREPSPHPAQSWYPQAGLPTSLKIAAIMSPRQSPRPDIVHSSNDLTPRRLGATQSTASYVEPPPRERSQSPFPQTFERGSGQSPPDGSIVLSETGREVVFRGFL